MTDWYYWQGDDLFLNLRVQPRASHDEWVGRHGAQLRLRITAPPSDGKANKHLCRFLAQIFRVPFSKVILVAGDTSRSKKVCICAPRQLPPGIVSPRPLVACGSSTQ